MKVYPYRFFSWQKSPSNFIFWVSFLRMLDAPVGRFNITFKGKIANRAYPVFLSPAAIA